MSLYFFVPKHVLFFASNHNLSMVVVHWGSLVVEGGRGQPTDLAIVGQLIIRLEMPPYTRSSLISHLRTCWVLDIMKVIGSSVR